ARVRGPGAAAAAGRRGRVRAQRRVHDRAPRPVHALDDALAAAGPDRRPVHEGGRDRAAVVRRHGDSGRPAGAGRLTAPPSRAARRPRHATSSGGPSWTVKSASSHPRCSASTSGVEPYAWTTQLPSSIGSISTSGGTRPTTTGAGAWTVTRAS